MGVFHTNGVEGRKWVIGWPQHMCVQDLGSMNFCNFTTTLDLLMGLSSNYVSLETILTIGTSLMGGKTCITWTT